MKILVLGIQNMSNNIYLILILNNQNLDIKSNKKFMNNNIKNARTPNSVINGLLPIILAHNRKIYYNGRT